MRTLERIADVVDLINGRFGVWVSYILIPLFLYALVNVIARYAFNNPLPAGFEISGLINAGYVMLSGAYALLTKQHVRMDVAFSHLSPRGKAIMDMVTSLFFFIFMAAYMYAALNSASNSVRFMETSQAGIAVPYWPVKLMMPIGGGLLALQGISKLIRDALTVMKKGGQP